MLHSIVAVLCGPHENRQPSFRRIDAAIDSALLWPAPLLIVGDGNLGQDVRLFAEHAREAGVSYVHPYYDERASTLADVQMISQCLHTHDFVTVGNVILVTDQWHMLRASLFLAHSLFRDHPDRLLSITPLNVPTPPPPQEVLEHETHGVHDFLAGRYGQNGHAVQYGKPSHPDSVEFSYEFTAVDLPSLSRT